MHYAGWDTVVKKTLEHPKADKEKRTEFSFKIEQYEQEGRSIVYLDESGFAKDMPRTHGYSTTGQRCYGTHDWHARGRINVIGAIVGFKLLTTCMFDTNINSDIFYAWLTEDLLLKVPQNSIIVMDNATFHKRTDMIKAIKDDGHTLEFLPPYSPDLNPIEHKWAQAKSLRRKIKCEISELFCSYEL